MILINLLPHREFKRKESIKAFGRLAAVFVVLAIIVIGLLLAYTVSQVAAKKQENDLLTAQIQRLDLQIKTVQAIQEEIRLLNNRIRAVESLQSERNNATIIFNTLQETTPEGIRLVEIVQQDGGLLAIKAYAVNQEIISQYVKLFESKLSWYYQPELFDVISNQRQIKNNKTINVFEFGIRVVKRNPFNENLK